MTATSPYLNRPKRSEAEAKYSRFVTDCQRKQRRYIAEERKRFVKASRLFDTYAAKMQSLGLHALTRQEIEDRERQLSRMERDVPVTHGDTATMRYAFDMHSKT